MIYRGDIKRGFSSSFSRGERTRSINIINIDYDSHRGDSGRRQHSVADRGRRVGLTGGRERRPGRDHGQGEEHGRARTLVRKRTLRGSPGRSSCSLPLSAGEQYRSNQSSFACWHVAHRLSLSFPVGSCKTWTATSTSNTGPRSSG